MFNGCSKVFEIKTEFDSDFRLPLQLENYKKAFNQIYLIVPETKLKLYEKYDSSIGLITFNSSNENSFEIIQSISLCHAFAICIYRRRSTWRTHGGIESSKSEAYLSPSR